MERLKKEKRLVVFVKISLIRSLILDLIKIVKSEKILLNIIK